MISESGGDRRYAAQTGTQAGDLRTARPAVVGDPQRLQHIGVGRLAVDMNLAGEVDDGGLGAFQQGRRRPARLCRGVAVAVHTSADAAAAQMARWSPWPLPRMRLSIVR